MLTRQVARYYSGKCAKRVLTICSAMSNGQKYNLDMEMFKGIVKDESKWNLKGRNVLINISKKDKDDEEWWPRLTKDKVKNQLITIDWARWKDADDEDEPEDQQK